MIKIIDKSKCCGCEACVQKCPNNCIELESDNEGFLYPKVNLKECIDCHLCETVCPITNQGKNTEPLHVYAAKNLDDEIRYSSSSGGVFTMLAEVVLKRGGVVFGVTITSENHVEHQYTETIEGLSAFRGSKYVQSSINNSFVKVKSFLKAGRDVLFSGTPCQVAGLLRYLGKKYPKLLCVDFICHGVPSPKVFHDYLLEFQELISAHSKTKKTFSSSRINNINKNFSLNNLTIAFRDKRIGWEEYCFSLRAKSEDKETSTSKCFHDEFLLNFKSDNIQKINGKVFSLWHKLPRICVDNSNGFVTYYNTFKDNIFLRGFLHDLFSRPSCYSCPTRQLRSGSDLTLGDFWGIRKYMPDFYDTKGISAVVVNSIKGKETLFATGIELKETSYKLLSSLNPSIIIDEAKMGVQRKKFFNNDDLSVHQRVLSYAYTPFYVRLRFFIIKCVSFFFGRKGFNFFQKLFKK